MAQNMPQSQDVSRHQVPLHGNLIPIPTAQVGNGKDPGFPLNQRRDHHAVGPGLGHGGIGYRDEIRTRLLHLPAGIQDKVRVGVRRAG